MRAPTGGTNGFLVRAAATEERKGCDAPEQDHKEGSGASNSLFRIDSIDSEAPRNVSLNSIQGQSNRLISGDMRMASTKRLLPTGECWCGCGAETAIGSFFLPGHDKTAESAVISVEYGGVPGFLVHHGYGPGGKNALREVDRWRSKGKRKGEAS